MEDKYLLAAMEQKLQKAGQLLAETAKIMHHMKVKSGFPELTLSELKPVGVPDIPIPEEGAACSLDPLEACDS